MPEELIGCDGREGAPYMPEELIGCDGREGVP